MTDLWVSPVVTHRLAVALRFVDVFTELPVVDPLHVRLATAPWWVPVFGPGDSTYRFAATVEPIPALGPVDVIVEALDEPARYVNRTPLQVVVPPAGPQPSPLTYDHHLVVHPLEPSRAFRPAAGETAVRGVVLAAGAPQVGFGVAIGVGAAPGAAAIVVHTDHDGEFLYRLPDATAVVAGATVTTTAALHIVVTDPGGVGQGIAAPALPLVVPLGLTTSLSISLV